MLFILLKWALSQLCVVFESACTDSKCTNMLICMGLGVDERQIQRKRDRVLEL